MLKSLHQIHPTVGPYRDPVSALILQTLVSNVKVHDSTTKTNIKTQKQKSTSSLERFSLWKDDGRRTWALKVASEKTTTPLEQWSSEKEQSHNAQHRICPKPNSEYEHKHTVVDGRWCGLVLQPGAPFSHSINHKLFCIPKYFSETIHATVQRSKAHRQASNKRVKIPTQWCEELVKFNLFLKGCSTSYWIMRCISHHRTLFMPSLQHRGRRDIPQPRRAIVYVTV